jgi:hypothetical protein
MPQRSTVCDSCGAAIVFFFDPVQHRWCAFNKTPITDDTHPPARVFRIEIKRAWHFDDLVENLMDRSGCDAGQARDEAAGFPAHTLHLCRLENGDQ